MKEEEAKLGIELTVSAGAKLSAEAVEDGRIKQEFGGGNGMDIVHLLAILTNSVSERLGLPREDVLSLVDFIAQGEHRREHHEE